MKSSTRSIDESEAEDPPEVTAARASTGAAAPSDTALEPLLTSPVKRRPAWQYVSGVVLLVFAAGVTGAALQPPEPGAQHHLRTGGSDGVWLVWRHADAALGPDRLHREAARRRSRRRWRLAASRAAVGAERELARATAAAAATHASGSLWQCRGDARPRAVGIPAQAGRQPAPARARSAHRRGAARHRFEQGRDRLRNRRLSAR